MADRSGSEVNRVKLETEKTKENTDATQAPVKREAPSTVKMEVGTRSFRTSDKLLDMMRLVTSVRLEADEAAKQAQKVVAHARRAQQMLQKLEYGSQHDHRTPLLSKAQKGPKESSVGGDNASASSASHLKLTLVRRRSKGLPIIKSEGEVLNPVKREAGQPPQERQPKCVKREQAETEA